MIRILVIVGWLGMAASPAVARNVTTGDQPAQQSGVHEITLRGNANVANPFDTDVHVEFHCESSLQTPVTVRAFYDGGRMWRARLYVGAAGRWTWTSHAEDDSALDGQHGEFVAEASNLRGKLRIHRDNPRQWMTDDGRTFLNLADTAYLLFRSPNDARQPIGDAVFRRYVEEDVRLGISCLRAGGCGGYAGWSRQDHGVDAEADRSNWCWEADYDREGGNRYWERFDLDRFQTTDRRLRWMLNHHPDVYVQLIMFGKNSRQVPDGCVGAKWQEIPQRARVRTVEYMVARWSAWPQVFFQIVNDVNFTGDEGTPAAAAGALNQSMVREVGRHLSRVDPFDTLCSAGAKRREDNPFVTAADWNDWHTYLHIERQSEIDAAICDYYYGPANYNVPVHLFYGEDWYEQCALTAYHTTDVAEPDYYYRRLFWAVLLSGGSPCYGGRYSVLHPYSQTRTLPFAEIRGRAVYGDAPLRGLDGIRHLRQFLESREIDLAEFTPDDGLAEALPAPHPDPHGPSRAQCARRGYREILVYLPCASEGELGGILQRHPEDNPTEDSRAACAIDAHRTPSARIDLRQASGKLAVEWYRAADGATQHAQPVSAGGHVTVTSPWRGADVVLRLWADGGKP